MTVISSILCPSSEGFLQVIFDQQGVVEYAPYLSHGSTKKDVVLVDCNEAVRDDGDVNLYPNSILGITPEKLDFVSVHNIHDSKVGHGLYRSKYYA